MACHQEPIPEWIGEYQVEEKIGEGGQGRVYKCRDNIGAVVVLKCIANGSPNGSARVARLRKEAAALAQLRGATNIVYVHGLREIEGGVYLETQFIPGDDLSARLQEHTFGVREAMEVCVQIARGLEAAHGAGILHRDLKPRNVRVTGAGVVKIIDFGLAKLVDQVVDTEATTIMDALLTEEGVQLGTPGYMSPEQVRGKEADHRTDIWSFGCVLYECLTKKPAFRGESPSDALIMCLHGEPDMAELPMGVTERVRDLLEKCLQKNRDDRLQHIGDARVDLEAALRAMTVPAVGAPVGAARTGPAHNLPRRLPLFVGREQDLMRIGEALKTGRIAALTGVGGSGKSRLAVEFGWDNLGGYADGVWFVELAALTDASQVARTVARVLKVPEATAVEIERGIAECVGRKRMLLILDNCEHMVDSCARLIDSLLDACPNLRVLATTREKLGVAGEARIKLEALPLPEETERPDLDDLMCSPAVRLFVGKARQADELFQLTPENAAAVLHICRRVDGLPLAIILVASALGAMSVHEVAERLDEVLGAVSEGGKTIEGSIDWSYRRLSEKERLMLQRLSVFEGGWTRAAAEAVCTDGDDAGAAAISRPDVLRLLIELVGKSMVEYRQGPRTGKMGRYDMLQTIRAHARERLRESGGTHSACVAERFVGYIARLAAEKEPVLRGRGATECLRELSREHDNIRAAIGRCLDDGADRDRALLLAINVHRYCYLRGHLEEGAQWLRRAIGMRGNLPDALQARAWNSLGTMMWGRCDFDEAKRCFERSLEIRRALGDRVGMRQPLHNLALIHWKQRDFVNSERQFLEIIASHDPATDHQAIAELKLHLGCVRLDQGDYDQAEELFRCAAETLDDPQRVAHARHNFGEAAYLRGRTSPDRKQFMDAKERFEAALRHRREIGEPQGLARTLAWLAMTHVRLGEPDAARRLFAEADAIRARAGLPIPAEDLDEFSRMIAMLNGNAQLLKDQITVRTEHHPVPSQTENQL